MKRMTRDRRLTADEAAKYRTVRAQVADELPELIDRHRQRFACLENVDDVLKQLRAAREKQGLSLGDLCDRTGMDSSALSKLESDESDGRPDPTIATLVRYAEAVGLRLELSLIEAPGSATR